MTQISTSRKNIYKQALFLAVPMMLQQAITNAVTLVDNVMVGSLGTEAITAVSIVGQLIFVYSLATFGGISGPGIYGAQYYGNNDIKGVQNVFRIKWWIAIFIMILGIFVLKIFGENLINLYLQGESASIDPNLTINLALDYLNIMIIGLIPFTVSFVYAGSLRETDDSIKPMLAGIASVVIDIIFNYLLIFGNFGFPQMGVRGAALATVLGRIVEMFIIVTWSHARRDKHEFLKGVYKTLLVPVKFVRPIIIKSLPIFVNEFFWSLGIALLTQCLSLRGLTVVAGMNISNAICNLLSVVFVCMGSAVGIILGQYLGAGDFATAKEARKKLTLFSMGMSVLVTVICLLLSKAIPQLYNTTDNVREYATMFIIITALFFPVQALLNALYFSIRSGGKTFITFLFDSVFTCCVSVPIAYILCTQTALNVLALYAVIQAIDIVKVFIGMVLIKKGIWLNNLARTNP